MKKLFAIGLAALLLFAAVPVSADTVIPGSKITIDAIKVDYVSALAGIAKPTTQTYTENERFAVLVSVNVPSWYDTTNMKIVTNKLGLTLDNAMPTKIMTGDFLLFGTLYTAGARLEVIIQDNALGAATTAQALWTAVYGDRTVSAVVTFSPTSTVYTTQQTAQTVQVVPVTQVPATGGKPGKIAFIVLCVPLIAAIAKKKNYGGA